MVIAIPSNEDLTMCPHFGHAAVFAFYTVEEGKVVDTKVVQSPGHMPGVLPNLIADNGANVILASCMGQGALDLFNARGVEVVLGANGEVKELISKYLAGELQSSGKVCQHHHDHHHEGKEHHCGGHHEGGEHHCNH